MGLQWVKQSAPWDGWEIKKKIELYCILCMFVMKIRWPKGTLGVRGEHT